MALGTSVRTRLRHGLQRLAEHRRASQQDYLRTRKELAQRWGVRPEYIDFAIWYWLFVLLILAFMVG